MTRVLAILAILWWTAIAAVVVNHNLAPFGVVTLRWPNPQKPTVHFAWHQVPVAVNEPNHGARLDPGASRRFTVTLPRGFVRGHVLVSYQTGQAGNGLRLTAQALPGKRILVESNDSAASLDFRWSDLAARGRRFDFSLQSVATKQPILIQSVVVIARL